MCNMFCITGACEAGMFQKGAIPARCAQCPDGQISAAAAPSCDDCEAGQLASLDHTTCGKIMYILCVKQLTTDN